MVNSLYCISVSSVSHKTVFKNTGYLFPTDNGIMTNTIARDWDREEAKTKGGGAFVCLTINVRHSFISSEDSCPVFDILMV